MSSNDFAILCLGVGNIISALSIIGLICRVRRLEEGQ